MEPGQKAPALALANPQGIFATPTFLSVLGLDPPPGGVRTFEAWLEPLGFACEPGALSRGGRQICRASEGMPPGWEIAWLEEGLASADRQRRAGFLRTAAHDLRGPVANVRSFTSLLRTPDLALTPRAQRALQTIERSADRALALLQDYFASAQAEEGRLVIDVEPTDVAPLIRAAVEQASGAASAQGVAVEPEELAPLPLAWADPAVFRRALDAVLAWAIARTPPAGRVSIRPRRRADALEIEVSGAGAPLCAEELSHAFDREFWAEREGGLRHGFRLTVAAAELHAMGGAARILEEGGAPGVGLAVRIVSA